MLSRVAERIYWAARYLERAENSARLLTVYNRLLLDLPPEAKLGWMLLIDITGTHTIYRRHYRRRDERSVLRFLLSDERNNPGSLLSSLSHARENFRTTRDIVPTEGWRAVNELYLYAKEHLGRAPSQRRRNEALSTVISSCQEISGLLAGTMSHGDAYQFLRIGRNLERADMSTRVIDVAAATLLTGRTEQSHFDNMLWMAVLRSLSAYQMYRQYVRRRMSGPDVVTFLLEDPHFPHTVVHCLGEIAASVRALPRHEAPIRRAARLERVVRRADVPALINGGLHEFMDDLQLELGKLHDLIVATWIAPDQR